jgi:transposase
MNVHDFEKLVRSDKTASHYVLTRCGMTGSFRCPSCAGEHLYEIEGGKRRRCARCGHTFNPLAGRYLNNVRLSPREWLWLVKLFELETSATVIAVETGISYPTVLKAIDTIRCAIAETPCADRDAAGTCEAVRQLAGDADPSDVVRAASRFLHLKFGDECLVLTPRTESRTELRCGDRRLDVVDSGRGFPRLRVYCSAKGFWTFAKERLVKYHGVSLVKLPCYLDEMAFRWMNRRTPLFDLILERLCRYAPPTGVRARREEPVPELLVGS